MSSSKRLLHLADEFQPPTKKLISQAEEFIKDLAKKQQNTTVNLHHELLSPKEFCKGVNLISLANYNAGPSSLVEFQESVMHFDKIGVLKAAGLGEDEIRIYLDYQKGEKYLFDKHKNCEKSSLTKVIARIKDVVLKYEKQSVVMKNTRLDLSSSERLDSELSIKPCSTATKLYKFALENDKLKRSASAPSPMDNIKSIEENFLKSLNSEKLPNISKIRRKARKLVNRINRNNETIKFSSIESIKTVNTSDQSYVLQSKWDQQSAEPDTITQKKLYTCVPQNYYTIKDGIIVKLTNTECQAKALPCIQKLTIDEIKHIPKFENYEKGVPSKVLYLKNLNNNIKEIDLKRLFKNYDTNGEVSYKIMNGKMRGQAFITFADEVIASRALDDLNGTVLKNKPVIIQFGHGKG